LRGKQAKSLAWRHEAKPCALHSAGPAFRTTTVRRIAGKDSLFRAISLLMTSGYFFHNLCSNSL
jgi:hypothetical protein